MNNVHPTRNHAEITRPKRANCEKSSVEREPEGSRGISGARESQSGPSWRMRVQ